jgi:hypothetical protein
MPNNTAFFGYLEDQLEDPEFRKEFTEAYEKLRKIHDKSKGHNK